MTIVVFCGPTIGRAAVLAELDAEVRPPAARGDVLRAASLRPDAIGLIDGMFDHVPSVWHKEILWAMHQGVHVFGAASMGALRAAELDGFGMVGVGAIYRAFADGTLEDDDEVAVAHADAEHEYRPLSDAMVNIRATLMAARRAGILGEESRATLERIAKETLFAERSFGLLLEMARAPGVAGAELERLKDWMNEGRVDQKRADAVEMLRAMAAFEARGWSPKKVDYVFSHTHAWQSLERRFAESADDVQANGTLASEILEEVLVSDDWDGMLDSALARSSCHDVADRLGATADRRSLEPFVEEFRRARGLSSPADFERWLEEQRLDDRQATAFFERESMVHRMAGRYAGERSDRLADVLRANGRYGALAERARQKRDWLHAHGLGRAELRDTGRSEADIWQWYFTERGGRAVPRDLDAHARARGLTLDQLRSVVVREFLFALS